MHVERHSGDEVPRATEAGFTLVEMMVAFAVLSIVLAATAASLITFTRASVDNERRVQATAFLNSLHEELQAVPWPDALLYEEEAVALSAVGVDTSVDPPLFEGEPLAVRPGPGCVGPSCRIENVPYASEVVNSVADGRTYTVYRIITDVSRGGTVDRDVKRFTTIVQWESLGQTVEQRFDSERAPTPDEYAQANVPEVRQFLISPPENQLDEFGHPMSDMSISARFRDDVTDATLHLPNGAVMALTRDGTSNRFTGDIPTTAHTFVDGERTFEVRGTYAAGGYASATTAVTFLEWHAGVVAPVPPPVVTSVTATPLTLTAGRLASAGKGQRLCDQLVVSVRVDGLEPPAPGLPSDVSVTAFYEAGSPQGAGLVSHGGIDGDDDEFRLVFPQGTKSPWTPARGESVTDAFTITARNGDGPQAQFRTSPEVRISGPTAKNEKC